MKFRNSTHRHHIIDIVAIGVIVVGIICCGAPVQKPLSTSPKDATPIPESKVEITPSQLLGKAVRNGSIEMAAQAISQGANVNVRLGENGETPLHLAAEKGDTRMIDFLVSHGADMNARTNPNIAPIFYAELTGSAINNGSWTPLHIAAIEGKKEAVDLLLKKGADINAKSNLGWTPLNLAMALGKTEVVKSLIAYLPWDGKSPPVQPAGGYIEIDSAGVPYVHAVWTNVSNKIIDAYKVKILCFDRYGKPVRHYLNRTNVLQGQAQRLIYPTLKSPEEIYWYMHGFDLLTVADVTVTSVHFTDGTEWKPLKGVTPPSQRVTLNE